MRLCGNTPYTANQPSQPFEFHIRKFPVVCAEGPKGPKELGTVRILVANRPSVVVLVVGQTWEM